MFQETRYGESGQCGTYTREPKEITSDSTNLRWTMSVFVCTRGSEFARKNVHELIGLKCEGRFGFLYKSLEVGQIARNVKKDHRQWFIVVKKPLLRE